MSQGSIYHLVAAGRIPGMKIGKQWRFSRSTIDQWLQGTAQRSTDVLVVDDDPIVLKMIVKAFQEAGHRTLGAESVRKATSLLQEIEFDIVFLDLLLPDGTGLDVVRAVLGTAVRPRIILITGHPNHELIDEVRSLLPYVTILSKPVRLETLLELTTRITSRSKAVAEVGR
jgi:excisionase family DNA binding protein